MVTFETAAACIALATKHATNGAAMQSSAVLCLADACRAFDTERYNDAAHFAASSLAYSVGVSHADYKQVEAAR